MSVSKTGTPGREIRQFVIYPLGVSFCEGRSQTVRQI